MYLNLKIGNLKEVEENAREVLELVEKLNAVMRERPLMVYLCAEGEKGEAQPE